MKHLISVLFLFFSFVMVAQTPYSIFNSRKKTDVDVKQVSVANPWLGAKLSYSVNDEQTLYENFLFSAKVLYTPIVGEKYAVPIVGVAGLGSDNLSSSESGINFGVYPYYKLMESPKFALIGHGGVGYKVIAKGVLTGVEPPQQIRLLGGLEAAFFSENGTLPTTLSITPVYMYNTGAAVGNSSMLEVTGIMPISNGLGFLVDAQVPFDKGTKGIFRFGIIINGQL